MYANVFPPLHLPANVRYFSHNVVRSARNLPMNFSEGEMEIRLCSAFVYGNYLFISCIMYASRNSPAMCFQAFSVPA